MDYSATTRPYGCDMGWFFGKCCIIVMLTIAGLISLFTVIYESWLIYIHTLVGNGVQLGTDGYALALSILIVIFCITACCIVTAGIDHKWLTIPVLLIMLLLLVLCLIQIITLANGSVRKELSSRFEDLLDKYTSSDSIVQTPAQKRAREIMDQIQSKMFCCGSYGRSDYLDRLKVVPESCREALNGCTPHLLLHEGFIAGLYGFQEILWIAFGLNILCAYFLFSSQPNELNTPNVRVNLPGEQVMMLRQEPNQQLSIQQSRQPQFQPSPQQQFQPSPQQQFQPSPQQQQLMPSPPQQQQQQQQLQQFPQQPQPVVVIRQQSAKSPIVKQTELPETSVTTKAVNV